MTQEIQHLTKKPPYLIANTVFILRGIPGSGKTTTINRIVNNHVGSFSYAFISADSIMLNRYGKVLPHKLSEVHSECFSTFFDVLTSEQRTDYVFVDNTNIERWEWENYALLAKWRDYRVCLLNFETASVREIKTCIARNNKRGIDRVPDDVFGRMLYRYVKTSQPQLPSLKLLLDEIVRVPVCVYVNQ